MLFNLGLDNGFSRNDRFGGGPVRSNFSGASRSAPYGKKLF